MKHKTILLIEDDHLDIESVKRALKKLEIPHTLHVLHNGVEAVAKITGDFFHKPEFMPDIILLDINMPKMNGIEFLNSIKSFYNLKDIKIFIITTSLEESDKLATENLGVTGYILKPLNFNEKPSPDTMKLKAELLQ